MPFADSEQAKFSSLRMHLILAMALAASLLPPAARAQISFAGAQETLFTQSSSNTLSPIAVDSNGDAFFVTSDGTTTNLVEVPANGSPTTINGSFPFVPSAIAVDSAGANLFFIYSGSMTNCGGGFVLIATAATSNGIPTNMPCSFSIDYGTSPTTVNYSYPTGLAVDPSGNLWIVDDGGGDFFEIPAPVTASSVPTEYAALTSGQPFDIAVNGNGEVYFTLFKPSGSSEIQEVADIPTSSFTNNLENSAVASTAIVTHVPSIESGLAINSTGNLYLGGSTVDSEVVGSSLITVDSDFADGTEGLASDSNGNLYIAGADTTGTEYVVELNKQSASFGSQPVEQTSSALTLNFIITNTTVGSIGVLTTGQANMDFASAAGTTCAAQAYTSATACVVNVTFTPMAPGLRTGALVFYSGANSTGTVLAKVPLYGVGQGPQIGYFPGNVLAIDPTVNSLQLEYPVAVAVDGAGDVYIADYSNNRVVKVQAGGGTATSIDPSVNGKTLAGPEGVALDGAGDLFICDAGNRRVVEVAIDGTLTAINPVVNATGLNGDAGGLAVDGAGDLFIADQYNQRVVEVPAGGGAAIAIDPTVNGESLAYPVAVAVDGAGDLFIADYGNSRVVKVPPGGGAPTAIAPAPNGQALDGVVGVAVDAAGDLYISSFFTSQIVEVPADGSAPTAVDTFVNGSAVFGPQGVAVDTAGNLFIADYETWRIVEVQHSVPPTLNFPTPTPAGSTDTADGTMTVQVENIGNQALNFSTASYPADFSSASDPNACDDSSLNPGQECDVLVQFSPQHIGLLSENVALTDNNLNVTGATQSIGVSGVGLGPSASLSAISLSFGSIRVGSTSASQSVTLTDTGSLALSITSIAVSGADASSFGFANSCGSSLAAGANCSIHGHFAPTTTGPLSAIVTITDNAGGSPQTVTLSGIGVIGPAVLLTSTNLAFGYQTQGTASASQSVTMTNTGGSTLSITGIAVTGTSASLFAFSSNCGTSLAAGANCTIHGHFSPTTTGAFSAAVTITDNASGSPQSIALSGTGVTGPAIVSLSSTSLSFGNQAVGTTSASQTVTLTNTGGAPLTITGIAVNGTGASSYVFANSCGATLAVAAKCTIHGHFTPATSGALSAAVTITDSAGGSPHKITLSGTGTTGAPAVSLSATSLTFASQVVGTSSASQSVTLTNTGGAPLTITSIAVTGANASSFAFANSCGTSLAIGANCTIHGHFAPTATGPLSAAITINDNAGESPQSITLSGTGH